VSERRWLPGDEVILRNTGFFVGEAWATPHIIVEDSDERVVLFRPEGTRYESWSITGQRLVPLGETRMDMLRLMFPGRDYAVELFFDAGNGGRPYAYFEGAGRFRGWKVNIEAPFERFALGFNTTDHFLDIIVRPDGRYVWKDGEVMADWLARGAYRQEEVERFYRAGGDLEPLIEARESPFDSEWTEWRPDPAFRPAAIPPGWQTLPGIELTHGLGRRWNEWPGR
jgi:predicted RNA-binding protein associated with RNAse of E/G family